MNPFFVFGPIFVAWALIVAFLGITSEGFPGGAAKVVGGMSVLLAVVAIGSGIYGAAREEREGGKAAPEGKPQSKQVFASAGCGSCHTLAAAGATGDVGPKLDDLAPAAERFGKQRGETAAQYVKESIVDPRAFTVPGFPKTTMPTDFASRLSAAQIDALVHYLLRGQAHS